MKVVNCENVEPKKSLNFIEQIVEKDLQDVDLQLANLRSEEENFISNIVNVNKTLMKSILYHYQ